MASTSSILISAFEPFGGSDLNASLETVKRLAARHDNVEWFVVPVVRWAAQHPALERLSTAPAPRLYLALGEAGPDPVVRLEKIAHNEDDFRIPDNAGNSATQERIEASGPDTYEATIPVDRIAEELTGKTPLPVVVSLSAGRFLCNHLAYAVSHALADKPTCPFCFIHVPNWRPDKGEEALEAIVETVDQILTVALRQAE